MVTPVSVWLIDEKRLAPADEQPTLSVRAHRQERFLRDRVDALGLQLGVSGGRLLGADAGDEQNCRDQRAAHFLDTPEWRCLPHASSNLPGGFALFIVTKFPRFPPASF